MSAGRWPDALPSVLSRRWRYPRRTGTLFARPEFREPANFAPVQTPYQYVVSAVRCRCRSQRAPVAGNVDPARLPLYAVNRPPYKNTKMSRSIPRAAQRISFATALRLLNSALNYRLRHRQGSLPPRPSRAYPAEMREVLMPARAFHGAATRVAEISPECATRIAAVDPPTLRAALLLGGLHFYAPLTCIRRRNMNRRILQALSAREPAQSRLDQRLGQDL